jgi:hypothetical protein
MKYLRTLKDIMENKMENWHIIYSTIPPQYNPQKSSKPTRKKFSNVLQNFLPLKKPQILSKAHSINHQKRAFKSTANSFTMIFKCA